MLDQASELRELVNRKNRKRQNQRPRTDRFQKSDLARVLSVTSGKGGVGKSNLAVNLSIKLASRGNRVVLLDMDLGLANVDILLDINPKYNLSHLIRNEVSVAEGLVRAPGDIFVLPGASGVNQLVNLSTEDRKKVLKKLAELQKVADIVVIDTGAGISRDVIPFAACADDVLTVTTPEPTARMDAYSTIKKLSEHPNCGDIRVIVNMAESREEALETARGVERVARRFLDVYVQKLGYVLRDENVSSSVRTKTPVCLGNPEAPASRCIETLAGILTGNDRESENKESSFLRRCIEWLLPT